LAELTTSLASPAKAREQMLSKVWRPCHWRFCLSVPGNGLAWNDELSHYLLTSQLMA